MSSLNNILAQTVVPTVAPLPLQSCQFNNVYANQYLTPTFVGLVPNSQAAAGTNTTIIQAALVAGATVTIPVGIYYINDTLNITGNSITLQGMGGQGGASVLKMANSINEDMIDVNLSGASVLTGFQMQGLVLDGNQANNSTGHALYLNSVFQPIIQNCTIQFAANCGIYADAPSALLPTSLMTVDKCHINHSAVNNIFINSFAQDSQVLSTFCEVAQSVGIVVKGNGTKLIHSHSFNSVSHNVALDAFSARSEVHGCVLDNSNTGWGLVSTGSTGNIITNNIFFSEFSGGISLDTSSGQLTTLNVVSNNVLYHDGGDTYSMPVGINVTSTNTWNIIFGNSVASTISSRYSIAEPRNIVLDPFTNATFSYNNMLEGSAREQINQVSGATPVTSNFQNSLITFTGIASTAVGGTQALVWDCTSIASSSVIRATLLGQSVASTANFSIQSISPGTNSATITVVSNGAAATGAAGSVIILLEFIS